MALEALVSAFVCFAPQIAAAEEKVACEQFDWSVKRELALFREPDLETIFSGATLPGLPVKGVAVELQPHVTVDFALPPGREPKTPESLAGIFFISNVPQGGLYQVTVSGEAWIDVIQNGKALDSPAHTGKHDCAAVRKSVRFNLEPGPLTVQVSSTSATPIRLAILPAE
jgi:hypothetical protein